MKLILTDSKKVSHFSSILKNLKNFSQDIEMHIDQHRLYAQGMDSSHCCLFELELLSEWFTKYECGEHIRLGINCELLAKIFNMLGENQNIEMAYQGTDSLYITLSPNEGEMGIVREFKLPLMDLQSELLTIPDTEYTADIEMVSNDFTALIIQLNTFGNELRVQCQDEIRLTGKGEMGSMDAVIKEDDILMYAIEEDEKLDINFALGYINMMVAFGKINKKVKIHMSENLPMKIQYGMDTFMDKEDDDEENEDKNYIRFFLAPKIDDV
jgi:proliferating cell nuclear antigen PCNA